MRLDERARRTEAVIARFRARAFGWNTGGTCLHLARAQMRAMGHKPPTIPHFYSAVGARRALLATGYTDLTALLDSMLPQIAPAAMWVGDLAVMDSGEDDPFDAIVVSAGRLMVGYHADHLNLGVVNIDPLSFKGAWRL